MAFNPNIYGKNTAAITGSYNRLGNTFMQLMKQNKDKEQAIVNAKVKRAQQQQDLKEQRSYNKELLTDSRAYDKTNLADSRAYSEGINDKSRGQQQVDLADKRSYNERMISDKRSYDEQLKARNLSNIKYSGKGLDPYWAAKVKSAGSAKEAQDIIKMANNESVQTRKEDRSFTNKSEQKAINIENDRPKVDRNFRDVAQDMSDLDEYIDEAITKSNFWSTGMGAETMSMVGGTNASELATVLDRIQSSTVLDKMAEMKSQSSTGATGFGAMNESELKLLKNAKVALSQSQTAEEFDKNARKLKKINKRIMRNMAEDYSDIYGVYPEGYNPDVAKIKSQSDFDELPSGSEFINPSNGKVMRKN